MAVPQRRTSKTRKRKRRTHFKLTVPGMHECPSCGEQTAGHRACSSCGVYKGQAVVKMKAASD